MLHISDSKHRKTNRTYFYQPMKRIVTWTGFGSFFHFTNPCIKWTACHRMCFWSYANSLGMMYWNTVRLFSIGLCRLWCCQTTMGLRIIRNIYLFGVFRAASWFGSRQGSELQSVGAFEFRTLCADGFLDGTWDQSNAGWRKQANERFPQGARRSQKLLH